MNRITKILIERDGLTEQEANQRVDEVRDMCFTCTPGEIDDILMDELGIEPDYLFDLFG